MNQEITNHEIVNHDEIRIRHIADRDWDGIVALESRAYSRLGLSEGRAALKSKAHASPATCYALDLGGRLAGYLLALPYPESAYPDLCATIETRPALPSRNLHLHDIVVAPDLRHRGLARHLLHHLTAAARSHGYERLSLVAVGGSETFWAARGFTPGHVSPAGYGPTAVYMSKAVPAGPAPRTETEKWADAGAARA
ncbi:GNAT family N-acetyltransferase [Streptomyces sp. KN37]|uniref:GNAT family N-acetyltransferase n=1 Tax=Streptomyces sp. KN37 TaxID=3090667 RepID=UPI002A761CCB|nr:GNAT family N-acetyltransferase [Streptomyces sp. KN37]WPO75356.1 GNAT family N-acetyltransferase [Streptomyces sp. KN37]